VHQVGCHYKDYQDTWSAKQKKLILACALWWSADKPSTLSKKNIVQI
jgi:hypothetical protein